MLMVWLLSCQKPAEPDAASEVLQGAGLHVSVPLDADAPEEFVQPLSERDQILTVLRTAQAAATTCYTGALIENPALHGELVSEVVINADGSVRETAVAFSTLNHVGMVDCVQQVVATLTFPELRRGEVVVRYPFVFTSGRTPSEVVRALQIRNGLLNPGNEFVSEEPDAVPARGENGWWEAW